MALLPPAHPNDAQFVIYFILAIFSMIGNSLVLWSLIKIRRNSTCFTYLLGYLHGSTIAEQFFTLPYLFKGNFTLCRVIQSLQCYFGFMNVLVVAILVEAHLTTIFDDPYHLKNKIVKYGNYVFFILPLIVFFGFGNNTFGHTHSAFCVVPSALASIEFIFFYYLEIWALLFYSGVRMIYSFIRILRVDHIVAQKYFSSIGFYIIVGLIAWIPRSIIRFSFYNAEDDDGENDDTATANSLFLIAFYFLAIAGIFFSIIYFREKASIKSFAQHNRRTSQTDNLDGELFSWEEILNEPVRSQASISMARDNGFFKNLARLDARSVDRTQGDSGDQELRSSNLRNATFSTDQVGNQGPITTTIQHHIQHLPEESTANPMIERHQITTTTTTPTPPTITITTTQSERKNSEA